MRVTQKGLVENVEKENVEKRKRKYPYMEVFFFFSQHFPFRSLPFRRFPLNLLDLIPHFAFLGTKD